MWDSKIPTRGSAFVRVRDSSGRILLVFNSRKILPNGAPKPPGWSLPGGGIKDYVNSGIVREFGVEMLSGCQCETPIEAAVRELFEEAGIIINVGTIVIDNIEINVVEQLNALSEELTTRNPGQDYFRLALQSYIETIHQYALDVSRLELIKLVDTGEMGRPDRPVYVFDVDVKNLVDIRHLTTKNDLARNTKEVRWFSDGEIKKAAERKSPGGLGRLWIYRSTLKRLEFARAI